jgi:hypothetical protein
VSEWDCYDQHISERNKLITAKKEAEDGFIKTIVQLSSAIVLGVPGVLIFNDGATRNPSTPLWVGILIVGVSLIFALSEQFLSSVAYRHQIAKTDAYYGKETVDIGPPPISRYVQRAITMAFLTFILGVGMISASLLIGPWK